jgi:RNA polymerase sigma-70 factor (ECF subfamily)
MATTQIGFCEAFSVPMLRDSADTVLVTAAQRGSLAAFEELVRRYDKAVLRLALRFTRCEFDAQDIYQEVFIKAYKNIGKFRSESSFYSWLYRIVSNLCLDRLRSRRTQREQNLVAVGSDGQEFDWCEQVADPHPERNPEASILQSELQKHIQYALKKLTTRERIVFELKHFEGLRLRAVGEILNTSEETAKNTLFRATRKLRSYLGYMRTA